VKKQTSGQIIFSVYAIFLFVIAALAWQMNKGSITLVSGMAAFVVLVGAILQFIPREKQVVGGYSAVCVASFGLCVFFLFRLMFPGTRMLCLLMILVCSGVSYHCVKTLMVKKS